MTHKTSFPELSADWSELDVLVLREFEFLERRAGKSSPQDRRHGEQHEDTGVVFLKERTRAKRRSASEPLAEETALTPADRSMDGPAFDLEHSGPAPISDFFNAEDRAFIARSVEWLRGRASKDMILSRIWEELQQTEPEEFFAPADEVVEPSPIEPEEQGGGDDALPPTSEIEAP